MTVADGAEVEGNARYRVRSVERSLQVIESIADDFRDGQSVTEIARHLAVSKSSAYAIAQTLCAHGFLRETQPGPRYHLGLALLRLGDLAAKGVPLGEMCRPALEQLTAKTGLTSRAAITDNGYPVFVDRVDGTGSVRFHTLLGTREAPHVTAAGKSILASLERAEVVRICTEHGMERHTRNTITELPVLFDDLERTRRRGYSVDEEEDVEGIFCIGAPFFDHNGKCVGALSVTGIKADVPAWRMQELGDLVADQADVMTRDLSGQVPLQWGRSASSVAASAEEGA